MIKIDLSKSSNTPKDMDGQTIEICSTSSQTANTSPIVLNQTEQLSFKFNPVLVDNIKDPNKSLSGKLVYERKRKKDSEFPTNKMTKRTVKTGDWMEISLNTTETYNLYQGLKELYELKGDIGSTPYGNSKYTKINPTFTQFKTLIENDPSTARSLTDPNNFELVKILLQLITTTESHDSLKNGLQSLNQTNIENLSSTINLERLKRVSTTISDNLNNRNEEFWQQLFNENQWVISQMFSFPYTIFADKAYVGGKGTNNKGGNVCDFLYQNKSTKNIALIEIKTPVAKMFSNEYRNTYSLSNELSGSINQVLNYRDSLIKEFGILSQNSEKEFKVLDPKCVVIIGCHHNLNPQQKATLERYRNTLSDITLMTFDELLQKINDTIALFEDSENELSSKTKILE